MKMIIILVIALMLQGMAFTQSLDTISGPGGRVDGYHYTWWYDSCMGYFDTVPNRDSYGNRYRFLEMGGSGSSTPLTMHRFSRPAMMNGVAVMAMDKYLRPPRPREERYPVLDTTPLPEYVSVWLYDSSTNSMQMQKIAELRWDTAHPKVYKLPTNVDTDLFGFEYTRVYEVMFDPPILVDSTVYFKGTVNNVLYGGLTFTGSDPCYLKPQMLYYYISDNFEYATEYIHPEDAYQLIFGENYIYEGCHDGADNYYIDDKGQVLERREREESRFGRFLPIVDYANVSVSPDDTSMGSAGPTDRISKQTTVNIHATPEYGFRFVRWNDGNTDNPRPVFLTQDTAFTAYFEPKTRHQVSTECRAQGTGIVTGGGEYWYGDTVTLTAVPLAPYFFHYWNDGDTANPRTFVVTQDTSFTAYFGSQQGIAAPEDQPPLFTLTPNPAHSSVTVTLNSQLSTLNSQLSMTLTDAAGRELLNTKVSTLNFQLSVSQYPAGTYFLTLRTPDTSSTQRLVIK